MSVEDLPDMQIQRLNSKQECNLRRQDKHEHAWANTATCAQTWCVRHNCVLNSLQRLEMPIWAKQQCHTSQVFSVLTAGQKLSMWGGFSYSVSLFVQQKHNLMRLLDIKVPLVISLPIFEIRVRSWPEKSPPLVSQCLSENRLFQFLGT